MPSPDEILLDRLRALQWGLCSFMREKILTKSRDELSAVAREGEDDTIYGVDTDTEGFIIDYFEKNIAPDIPCRLVAEGLPGEGVVFSGSGSRGSAEFTVIMDPLDGTRGLMYEKRSAWVLAGAAPGADPGLCLSDITLAAQTEIAPPKHSTFDQLFAMKGKGARGVRRNLDSGREETFVPAPSGAADLHYGFATFSRFFPSTKEIITRIELELNRRFEARGENNFYFEDQYISSGGQLAELAMGRDRFTCDLRAVAACAVVASGGAPPICVHPYDVCVELIARESGVIITGHRGAPLSAPLDTTSDVSWIGYANSRIRDLIQADLLDIIGVCCG